MVQIKATHTNTEEKERDIEYIKNTIIELNNLNADLNIKREHELINFLIALLKYNFSNYEVLINKIDNFFKKNQISGFNEFKIDLKKETKNLIGTFSSRTDKQNIGNNNQIDKDYLKEIFSELFNKKINDIEIKDILEKATFKNVLKAVVKRVTDEIELSKNTKAQILAKEFREAMENANNIHIILNSIKNNNYNFEPNVELKDNELSALAEVAMFASTKYFIINLFYRAIKDDIKIDSKIKKKLDSNFSELVKIRYNSDVIYMLNKNLSDTVNSDLSKDMAIGWAFVNTAIVIYNDIIRLQYMKLQEFQSGLNAT